MEAGSYSKNVLIVYPTDWNKESSHQMIFFKNDNMSHESDLLY